MSAYIHPTSSSQQAEPSVACLAEGQKLKLIPYYDNYVIKVTNGRKKKSEKRRKIKKVKGVGRKC